MVELCTEHQVDLIVPTIDPELIVYAAAREEFAAANTAVAVSSPDVVAIASDKVLTHQWLTDAGFPTVAQGTVTDVRQDPAEWEFPLVVKPRFGSASIGVVVVDDMAGLDRATANWPRLSGLDADPERDLVVQHMAPGDEFTVDTLLPLRNAGPTNRVATVPRRRLEVRAGEVSKGMTVRSPALIELAEKLTAALPGAAGPLNIQMFYDAQSGRVSVIEINARFGGGFPLSFAAGADFPRALVEEVCGLAATASLHDWQDGLVMLRYDAAVFVDNGAAPSEIRR
jgi:carbamoyl-phosphate synthase large subunit